MGPLELRNGVALQISAQFIHPYKYLFYLCKYATLSGKMASCFN